MLLVIEHVDSVELAAPVTNEFLTVSWNDLASSLSQNESVESFLSQYWQNLISPEYRASVEDLTASGQDTVGYAGSISFENGEF